MALDGNPTTSSFLPNKRDKRQIKHSLLLSRLRTSSKSDKRAAPSRIAKPKTTGTKRRRPSKKLVTNLDALADALPVQEEEGASTTRVGAGLRASKSMSSSSAAKRQALLSTARSIKSRPGMGRRKASLERVERERYRRNLAAANGRRLLTDAPTAGLSNEQVDATAGASSEEANSRTLRWDALRRHIISSRELT
ncbi:MAG: hypothetical protein M1828_000003 [Chrysothrix sp. TS-e1954]|nr:MAG: hypothetical protein M1828_000003 [Chrysothrix sp. TS-e1954]